MQGVILFPPIRGLRNRRKTNNPLVSACAVDSSLARGGNRATWSDRRSKEGFGNGYRDRACVVRYVCPQSRAMDATGGPRPQHRGVAEGRLDGLISHGKHLLIEALGTPDMERAWTQPRFHVHRFMLEVLSRRPHRPRRT